MHTRLRIYAPWALAAVLVSAVTASAANAAPANDDFDAAQVVDALPFTASASTIDATEAADDPQCVGAGPTVWYSFTPATSVVVVADTFGSSYDTTLSAYTGTRGSLTQIDCNDDAGSLQSKITVNAAAGTTYYFMAGAFGSGPGGNLSITIAPAPTPPPPTGIGNSRGDGIAQSLCPPGMAMTGARAGVFSFAGMTVVGSVAAICGDAAFVAAPIGNAAHVMRDSSCPPGQVATSLNGRGGDLVDAVGVGCQTVGADGSPVGPVTEAALVGSAGGSPQGPFGCPTGEVIVGLDGTFRQGDHNLLDFVKPVCGVFEPTYAFSGFEDPIRDGVNEVEAGRVVPVIYRLQHTDGTAVDDPLSFESLTSRPTDPSCGTGGVVTELAPGRSGLQYLGDGWWQSNWTTSRGYAGQCRTLALALDDGSQHTAAFRFR